MVLVNPERALLADEYDTTLAVIPDRVAVKLTVHDLLLVVDGVGSSADRRDLVYRKQRMLPKLTVGGDLVAALVAVEIVALETASGGRALLAPEAGDRHGR